IWVGSAATQYRKCSLPTVRSRRPSPLTSVPIGAVRAADRGTGLRGRGARTVVDVDTGLTSSPRLVPGPGCLPHRRPTLFFGREQCSPNGADKASPDGADFLNSPQENSRFHFNRR